MRHDADAIALLQEVREKPEEDLPRLIFADWCEDHGDYARAEFIRVQIDRARRPRHLDAPHWRQREMALLQSHGRFWRRDLSPWLRTCVVFERGFIGAFDGPISALFRDDPSELGELAVLTKLRLRSDYSGKKYVGAWARHVREVQLPGNSNTLPLTSELLRVAPKLRTIRFHSGINSWNIEQLVELTRAYPLEFLELRDAYLSDENVPEMNALRVGRLGLSGRSSITPAGREALLLRYRERITFET